MPMKSPNTSIAARMNRSHVCNLPHELFDDRNSRHPSAAWVMNKPCHIERSSGQSETFVVVRVDTKGL